jgi:hypothetical protein
MRELAFAREEDVQQKLDGTLVRYKGEPCWCTYEGGFIVRLYTFEAYKGKGSNGFTVDCMDEALDYSAPALGYINEKKEGAVYLIRYPRKQFNGGLKPSQVNAWSLLAERDIGRREVNLVSEAVECMFKNKYPKFDEVVEEVLDSKGDMYSKAFHRKLAVKGLADVEFSTGKPKLFKKLRLYHTDKMIGSWEPDAKAFRINPKFKDNDFSITLLMNAGVKIC